MSKRERSKRKKAKRTRERSELRKQLLGYSLAAGAALVGAQYASADIVYSGPQNITVNAGNPTVGIDFDGVGGAEFAINFQSFMTGGSGQTYVGGSYTTGGHSTWIPTYTYGPYGTPNPGPGHSTWVPGTHVPGQTLTSTWQLWSNRLSVNPNAGGSVGTTGGYAANLPQSEHLGATGYWQPGTARLASAYGSWYHSAYSWSTGWGPYGYGNFLGQKGYIGVRFDDGGGLKYGWIAFEGAYDASWGLITGWAYENTGAEIHIPDEGVIPEPSGLALLATGAAGVMALRKKRKAA